MGLLSRFSFLLVSLLLIVALAAGGILLNWGVGGPIGLLILVAVLAIYWVGARRGDVTPKDPEKKLRRSRGAGRPVVVHFFSDFDLISLLRRPTAARREAEYRGRCEIILISVLHPQADALMESLRAGLGDYVFFDLNGKLAGRSQFLASDHMERFLTTTP